MDQNALSPYIRIAMFSTLTAPFLINERILFDYELIFVTGGMCRITLDGKSYVCKKDDAVLIPPNVPHRFECIDGTDFVQPHIHFDPIYSERSEETPVSFKPRSKMSDYERSLVQENIFWEYNIPYVFTPVELQRFQKLFFETIRIFQEKESGYIPEYKAKMLGLINLILRQFEERTEREGSAPSELAIVVKGYIDNNFQQIITLDALAKQFYINKFTLMRNFQRIYKTGVIAYYRERRIEFAKRLLQNTGMSVTAVGEQLGFNDICAFSRFFKMHAGVSPKDFRKNAGKLPRASAHM